MKNDNVVYVAVAFANALMELGKIAAFTFLSWYFNNIWIMLFYIICAGGGMRITHEKGNNKDE